MKESTDTLLANTWVLLKWSAAFVVAQWTGAEPTLRLLMIMMVLDWGTGLACAFINRNVSSSIGLRGIVKKLLIVVVVLLCHFLERDSGLDVHMERWVAIIYIANEAISILENVAEAGVYVPPDLLEAMKRLQKFRFTRTSTFKANVELRKDTDQYL